MDNTYMIREAVPDDAEKMISYLNQVGGESDNLLHGANEFTVPVEGVKRKLAMSNDSENSVVLIALDNEEIIARAELQGYYPARIRHRAVLSISVRKDHWGQGIGTEMMNRIFEHAKQMKIRVIELEVISDNERGINLYHKMGFEDIGTYKDYFCVNGILKDAVVMQKVIREQDMAITTKQFQLLTDINLVWDFLVEIYDRENGSGMPAPFFEHAIRASWMDSSYSYLDRLWFDGDKVVAFVYYEAPVTDIYFAVRKGYEYLADELIDYAITTMPDFDGEQQFVLFNGQEFLKEAAAKRGYKMVFEYESRVLDLENELDYELPEGYHFVEPEDIDILKLSRLCWYGFDHGDRQAFTDWDKYDDSNEWTPAKSHKDCVAEWMAPSPHATPEYDVVIADANGDYVCFAGMWWIPENKLAYMEPLCTAPEHRRKGLAAAALTKHCRRMKDLGATHMSGGGDPFYEKLGFGKGFHFTMWKRQG